MPTYDVNCPTCDQKHALDESDLGRNLSYAACGSTFRYDEPLKAARARQREKALARRAIETEEMRRRAAENQLKASERQRRGWR